MTTKQDILRKLPSVDEVMNEPQVAAQTREHDREVVLGAVRRVIDDLRSEITACAHPETLEKAISSDRIGARVVSAVQACFSPSLRWAINATGIILHTGLGRAVMPEAAIEAVNDVLKGYCTLATDIETGRRRTRDAHFADLLRQITGAEAATIANNNAAATVLVLNTLAKGKEVIVSRGQLVEIGGSFRMPDIMESSGAILREVGTTNKTYLSDYSAAINENTGAILRVHMSNYRIVGFFEEPSIEDLAKLAAERGLPIIDDLGSGALVDLADYGLGPEPMVRDSVRAEVDVACFSGDKLIGGPQAGIMVGKASAIKSIKSNPLARALRVGKMEVAALEATLRLFIDRGKLNDRHPTYRMLSLSVDEINTRAQAVASSLTGCAADISVIDGTSQVGSGSVPAELLPTRLLSVKPESISAEALAKKLRLGNPPIFARIHQEAVLLDFRTIQPGEDSLVGNALKGLIAKT